MLPKPKLVCAAKQPKKKTDPKIRLRDEVEPGKRGKRYVLKRACVVRRKVEQTRAKCAELSQVGVREGCKQSDWKPGL